ncbi:MAG: hypothetical protein V1859_11260 [archaeon]
MFGDIFSNRNPDKEWSIFAKSFNLCHAKSDKNSPVITGKFNGQDILIQVKNFGSKNGKKKYTQVVAFHKNRVQQKMRLLHRSAFPKLSLVHRINENQGYSYYDYYFTKNHILFSTTKIKNDLSQEIMKGIFENVRHELKISNNNLIYTEPDEISSHNRLIDLAYFLTEFSKEINENKFNQATDIVLK